MNQLKPASNRARWLIAILLAAIAIPSIAIPLLAIPVDDANGTAGNRESRDDSSNSSRPRVSVARAGTFAAPAMYQSYRGEIRARRESSLSIRRAGELSEVFVDVGDMVSKGDVLARLNTSDLDVRQQLADAELAAASASATEAVAGPRYQTIKAAAARVRQLQAQWSAAKARFARQQKLTSRNAGSEQELDDAKYASAELEATLDAATAELEELNEGTRAEQIEAAKAKRAAAEANRKQVDVDRQDSQIVAPYDAVVAERLVDEGEMLTTGKAVLRVLEVNPLEAHFGVPVATAADWEVGKTLDVMVDGHSIVAKISRMQPQIDPLTRTRGIQLELDNGGSDSALGNVTIGQTATLQVPVNQNATSDQSGNQFWLPTESLVRGSRGLWSVYVAGGASEDSEMEDQPPVDSVIQLREVKIVRASSDRSLVDGMIRRGEWVVVDGAHRIGPGVQVQCVTSPENTQR